MTRLIDEIHAEHDAILNQNLPASLAQLREIIKEQATYKDRWEEITVRVHSAHIRNLVADWAVAEGLDYQETGFFWVPSGLTLSWGARCPIATASCDAKIDGCGVLTRVV